MEVLKHVGSLVNTGKRIAVVFLQIPNKETHALYVDTDALPDRFHDALMKVLSLPEAQQAQNLGEVLARRLMPDTGRNMLEEFHINGMLESTPVTNIYLVPRPNNRVLLSDVLVAMGKSIEINSNKVEENSLKEETQPENYNASSRESFYNDNKKIDNFEENIGVAKNLLAQAELLYAEAESMKAKAFEIAPSLRPSPAKKVEVRPAPQTKKEESVKKVELSKTLQTKKVLPKNKKEVLS